MPDTDHQPRATADTPGRWWRDLRWITALVVLASVASIAWGLFGPEPRIVVSRETTVITEPLRPDGQPDYEAWLLDRAGRGTPPEDNAAVAVLQATWPMGLEPPDLAAVCRVLGIPDTPPDVPPFGDIVFDPRLRDELQAWWETQAASQEGPRRSSRIWTEGVQGLSREVPWRAAECPPLAAWVQRHAAALDLARDGAARPAYFMPAVRLLRASQEPRTKPMWHDHVGLDRVVSGLAARAMLHVGEGRPREAWRDLNAGLRLIRLVGSAGSDDFRSGCAIARSVCARAARPVLEVLNSPVLSADDARMIRRDLEMLPPAPDVLEALAVERVATARSFAAYGGESPRGRARLLGFGVSQLPWESRTSLDTNRALRVLNDTYDRVEAAARLPGRHERHLALRAMVAEAEGRVRRPTGWRGVAQAAHFGLNRAARSAHVGAWLVRQAPLFVDGALDDIDQIDARLGLFRVAAALAEYRLRGLGGPDRPVPDTLEALVPEVLSAVPSDPFTGAPLHYEPRGDGYLLYTVGCDGADEGGTDGELMKGEWREKRRPETGLFRGNIVVRMPRPPRSVVPGP